MTKRLSIMFAVVVLLCISVTKLWAYPLVMGGYNAMYFNASEVFVDNYAYYIDPVTGGMSIVPGADGQITPGDTFWGTLNLNGMKAPTDPAGALGDPTWPLGGSVAPKEVTGYFRTDVLAVLPAGIGADLTKPTIVLGPAAFDPLSILSGNEVIAIFEDNPIPTNYYSDSTQVKAISTATDGTLYEKLSLNSTAGDYWYTIAPVTPPGPSSNTVGTSFAGLTFSMSPNPPRVRIDDPSEIWLNGGAGAKVDMFFNAEIYQVNNITDTEHMHFTANDPGVQLPTPEPASMLLFGMGVLGLASSKLRRKKAA